MKSKISFFNKTIFFKNVTLYWPIWGIYSFILFLMQPATIWLSNNWGYFGDFYPASQRTRDLMRCLEFGGYVWLIAWAALVAGMALYSYMYNNKSANMIHAFPVDRTQLFGTTIISGLAFLVAPLFLSAIFSTVLCMVYAVPGIAYIWIWFLAVTATAFVAFSIVTICALFTGHIVVLPMYVVAVNVISWLVYFLVNAVITTFAFGVNELGANMIKLAAVLCPIQCFYENLEWEYEYSLVGDFESASFMGAGYICLYLVFSLVFYVSAYIIYRKRQIEQAGDFLTVNWVKPIFRSVIAIFGGIFGAMVARLVLIETSMGCGMPLFICILLLMSAIFYFAADMFIRKSFHVFEKKNWIRCGLSFAVVLVVFFSMYGMAEAYERKVPELDDIEYAQINWDYEVTLYGEDAAAIIEIQKDILEQAEYIESQVNEGDVYYYNSIHVRYKMKNGDTLVRRYPVLSEDENLEEIFQKILILEENDENYLISLFGKNYADISTFYGGSFNAFFIDPEDREKEEFYPSTSYGDKYLTEGQIKALYYALIEDIKAGTVRKYNVRNEYDMYGDKYYGEAANIGYGATEASISIEYEYSVEDDTYIEDEYGNYKPYGSVYIYIGPDCENVIKKLIELGIIRSKEHIWWGSAEEMLK